MCKKCKEMCKEMQRNVQEEGAPQCAQSSVTFCSGSSPAPLSLSLCGALWWTWMCTVHSALCIVHNTVRNKSTKYMNTHDTRWNVDCTELQWNVLCWVLNQHCWSSMCSTVKCGVWSTYNMCAPLVSSWSTVQCAVYTVGVHCTLYTVHFILCTVHCTLCILQCAVHDLSAADPWCHPNPRHQTRASYYQPPTTVAAHTRTAQIPLSCYATKA